MKAKLLTAAMLAALAGNASAASFSFTGTFGADDDVQLFDFSVSIESVVTLRTYSYAGGTQADGNVVSAGGFDPIMALFDGAGNLIDENDDGPSVPSDPNTGGDFDSELSVLLGVGDYTVAIMQYDNFSAGSMLSDGFVQQGNPFFTNTVDFGPCSNGQFCDVGGDNRTNEWAFDILDVDDASTVIPVPAAAWLFGSGLLGMVGVARRKTA